MENKPCATLTLRTSSSSISDEHNIENTWSNINLRALIGDQYDLYDDFNLILTQVASEVSNSALGTSSTDLTLFAKISGLPFLNQGYDNITGIKADAVLCSLNFVRSSPLSMTNLLIPLTFNKTQNLCNITITYKKLSGTAIATTYAYPSCMFIFKIYGVPK